MVCGTHILMAYNNFLCSSIYVIYCNQFNINKLKLINMNHQCTLLFPRVVYNKLTIHIFLRRYSFLIFIQVNVIIFYLLHFKNENQHRINIKH